MQLYQPRQVEFHQLLTLGLWRVKVYTITPQSLFASWQTLAQAVVMLPDWLAAATTSGGTLHHIAFLIVHEGRDGIWTLINWWRDENLLHSQTFFTTYETPLEFGPLQADGFMACVWEMAVLSFERAMWIEHVLKQAAQPDFTGYCQQYLHKEV